MVYNLFLQKQAPTTAISPRISTARIIRARTAKRRLSLETTGQISLSLLYKSESVTAFNPHIKCPFFLCKMDCSPVLEPYLWFPSTLSPQELGLALLMLLPHALKSHQFSTTFFLLHCCSQQVSNSALLSKRGIRTQITRIISGLPSNGFPCLFRRMWTDVQNWRTQHWMSPSLLRWLTL